MRATLRAWFNMVAKAEKVRPLGVLEQRVMDVLWERGPLAVRAVLAALPGQPAPAYTTIMTTLDRLYKKGLLRRERDGSAFVYQPTLAREAFHGSLVESAVKDLLRESGSPVLAAFVDVAARVDAAHLDELERLIAARKAKP